MPRHFKQRFSVVVPGRVHHSDRSGLLTIANKVDDVPGRRVEVGKNLVPGVRSGTNELIQTGVLERID